MENAHPTTKSSHQPPAPVFLAATVVLFFLTLSTADSVGFVPYYIDGSSPTQSDTKVALADLPMLGDASAPGVDPAHISIPAINLDLPVQNPTTRDVSVLDADLQNGPAHYVDSADLGVPGNVLIFAHSSHLPVVHNQMFRAFNRISELSVGDTITITGADGKKYLYSVESVRKADATDATIDLSPTQGQKLTLVTCDTLTGKTARFILVANFVGTI